MNSPYVLDQEAWAQLDIPDISTQMENMIVSNFAFTRFGGKEQAALLASYASASTLIQYYLLKNTAALVV